MKPSLLAHLMIVSGLFLGSAAYANEVELTVRSQEWKYYQAPDVDRKADCFSIEVRVDPVVAEGGDMQVLSGILIGVPERDGDRTSASVTVDLREGPSYSSHILWNRGRNLTQEEPDPKPAGWVNNVEYQLPYHHLPRDGEGHRVRLVVWPEDEGSRIRLFIDAIDRPCEEHFLDERITAQYVKLFAMRGGREEDASQVSRFSGFQFEPLTPAQAQELPAHWETVLRAIDFAHPKMAGVAQAIRRGKMDEARALFLRHMRTRNDPQRPTLDQVRESVIHPAYRKISDALLAGQFATVGYFDGFVDAWTDTNGDTHQWVLNEDPLQLNWAKDNGFLNRHFHWVSLAQTWTETKDGRYAKRFSDEVYDWVSREPFFWERTPTIGGLNIMDGTTFRLGYMNTSNIGRRLELTWWPAYEVFRKAPEFTDEAHFAMLVGMIRQAELITNPSSFAVHDDGAAHTTMALLQTALMLPEFKASKEWKALALRRWDEVLAKQFHPDGSHVSLSTGYNWATIVSLENFIRLFEQLGQEVPPKYLEQLELALSHPLLVSTPNQTQIPLNDGGWSLIDDAYQRSLHWFPHREDFKWMATRGAQGNPPAQKSVYFPNAGQYFMRTGWGPEEKYLFFGAGPWGASHGKMDALSIYAQFGDHLLIRDAGRGSYSGIGNTVHAGRSLSYNTLSPDWAQESSIPHWRADMEIGFHPPKRRWVSNERFDYGEGAFHYGWYRPGEHIQGKWLRQVIFVKGAEPQKDGYYIVIDTVEPADDTKRTWRHPWQLNPDDIAIDGDNKSVIAKNSAAALQILPVDPKGDLEVTIVRGQGEPELLGWRIYDTTAKEWPVPTYSWQADETFCRAWIIQMQSDSAAWPVTHVEAEDENQKGELTFTVYHKNGSRDRVYRSFPKPGEVDLSIVSQNSQGNPIASLEMKDGNDSVARIQASE